MKAVQYHKYGSLMHHFLNEFGGLNGMGAKGIGKRKGQLVITLHDGELTANDGDWVVQTEDGKIRIMSDREFGESLRNVSGESTAYGTDCPRGVCE